MPKKKLLPSFLRRKKNKANKLGIVERAKSVATPTDVEQEGVPRITNDTVAEHREAVLSGARRFIHPLSQSKNRIIITSVAIVLLVLGAFMLITTLQLYRYQTTNNFAYQVTQVIPFPIAKINGKLVPYEDYLFEVRHTLFYYRNHGQEGLDIDSAAGQDVALQVKKQAYEKVKLDAIARQIAKQHGIKVTSQEIDLEIERIRNNGGVGEERVLEDILQDFYNWEIPDLRKTLKDQLLRQKIPAVIDTETREEAEAALAELEEGAKFADVVKKYTDDQITKDNGGVIGLISRTNTDLPPEFIEAAFNLEEGQTSGLVESQFGISIVRVNKVKGDQREVAHVLLQYFDIDEYLKAQLEQATVKDYITFDN